MRTLAVSSWTWLAAAGMGLVVIGVLIRSIIVLIGRIKAAKRSLSASSGELNEALAEMRSELERANEELAELRRRHESDAV
jgi:prefoldin subunit 5